MISLVQARKIAFFNFLIFLGYLILNIFSELSPINGVTTIEVRHEAMNYLIPDDLTFRIRPVLFVILFLNSLYMLISVYRSNIDSIIFLNKIHSLFTFAVFLQPMWLLAFHAREHILAQIILIIICINVVVMQVRLLKYTRRYYITPVRKFLLTFAPQFFTRWMVVVSIAGFANLLSSTGWDTYFPGQFIINAALLLLLLVYFIFFVFRGAVASTVPIIWYLYRLMNTDLSLLAQHRLFLSLVHALFLLCLFSYIIIAVRSLYVRVVSY